MVLAETKDHLNWELIGKCGEKVLKGKEAKALKDAYKTLFLSGLTQADALAQLKSGSPTKEVSEWIAFIEAAGKRGIMRPAAGVAELEEAAA